MTESIPQKQCNRCKQILPTTEYSADRSKKDGLHTLCKACRKTPKAVRLPMPNEHKQCTRCKQLKPATTEFFKAIPTYQSPDGLHQRCKECLNADRRARRNSKPRNPCPQSEYKICRVCKQQIPATLEYFYINTSTRDCLHDVCKQCHSEYGKMRYRKPEVLKTYRAYRQAHTERRKVYDSAYRELHRDHVRQYQRRYRDAYREKNRAYWRRYRKTAKGRVAAQASHYRYVARKRAIPGHYTRHDVLAQYQRQDGKCYYCKVQLGNGKYAYHVDHVVPLSRGGSNGPENIVIACPTCNRSKSNKLPHEWLRWLNCTTEM